MLPRPLVAAAALATLVAGCVDAPGPDPADPNEGLLRDFVDGKYDAEGHPLNAKILAAAESCAGAVHDGIVELTERCELALPEGAGAGGLTINARLRVRQRPRTGTILTLTALDPAGMPLGTEKLTVARLRRTGRWIDLPITIESFTRAAHLAIQVEPGARVELDYVEVFPTKLGIAINPGSGVYGDDDLLTFELPRGKKIEQLQADGVDLDAVLAQLLDDGKATRTSTAFRTLITARVGDLLLQRGDVTELRVHSNGNSARVQLRKAVAPCAFEGDPAGTKVLVTGFQPFPADGWHENISAVAVTSLEPGTLRDAQVMRLVLPVEYDRAAEAIAEVIARCAPAHVISFGQGGGSIALEETAYNLQDTGELSGGAADNRGIIRAAAPIFADDVAERATRLPLEAIETALVALGEQPSYSDDPGRYICNNVMYVDIAEMQPRGGRAGFIHLPYTTTFDDVARARWGRVAEAAVQATVDAP